MGGAGGVSAGALMYPKLLPGAPVSETDPTLHGSTFLEPTSVEWGTCYKDSPQWVVRGITGMPSRFLGFHGKPLPTPYRPPGIWTWKSGPFVCV